MFGYTCNEIIFVHCPDDFASPPVSLPASVSTRVWNSIWKAAVQWNCYFNILLKFYGRFSSTPSKANCFTCFRIYFFQRKNDYTKNCLEIEVPLEIQFLYLVFTKSQLLLSCHGLILCILLLSNQQNTLNHNQECVAVCNTSILIFSHKS